MSPPANALLSFFSGHIHAYVSHLIIGGNLSGDYILQSYRYDHDTKKWTLWTANVDLKHGGTRMFGTKRSTETNQTWSLFGYFRAPFLALAYENNEAAAVGTGTYTLQQDVPYALWGHWIGVECDSNINQRFLAQCPCVLYLKTHPELQARYSTFMNRECLRITKESARAHRESPLDRRRAPNHAASPWALGVHEQIGRTWIPSRRARS